MITQTIIEYFLAFITWIVNFLPSFKISLNLIEGQTALWSTINNVSCLVPVGTVITILGLIFVAYSIEFSWGVLNWLIKKIPTID